MIKGKKGKDGKISADKEIAGLAGIEGRMISPQLLIDVYFTGLKIELQLQEQKVETTQARITEIEEEHNTEDGLFADLDKVNAAEVSKLLKIKKNENKVEYAMVAEPVVACGNTETIDEIAILEDYLQADYEIKIANKRIKELNIEIEQAVIAKYPSLSESGIKDLVINKKWSSVLQHALTVEQEKLSQTLTQRIKELAERYSTTLSSLEATATEAENKVKEHLKKMGLVW